MPTEYHRGYRIGYIEAMKEWHPKHDKMVNRLTLALVISTAAFVLVSGVLGTVLLTR